MLYNITKFCEAIMNTISTQVQESITINKSEFIATIIPIKDQNSANESLNTIRKKYSDATHNCYAFIYGKNGEYAKNSDDGEPSQTAGVVIYNVLQKNNLTNVLCVVTRYFGGIKLGAGGLVRAYTQATTTALAKAEILEIIEYTTISITIVYQYLNQVLMELERINAKITNKIFLEDITITFTIPKSNKDTLISNLINLTKNTIKINEITDKN